MQKTKKIIVKNIIISTINRVYLWLNRKIEGRITMNLEEKEKFENLYSKKDPWGTKSFMLNKLD